MLSHTAFDRSGKYLYFTASTNVGPAINFADLSSLGHPVTRSVYAIVLRNDLPSPLAPESDEEKEVKAAAEKPPGNSEDKPPTSLRRRRTRPLHPARPQRRNLSRRSLFVSISRT
jgi:tricorn protease